MDFDFPFTHPDPVFSTNFNEPVFSTDFNDIGVSVI